MNNKNSGRKDQKDYEDESMNNKNRNFDFEFDIEEANEYFINGIRSSDEKDYKEAYQKGFKDGYEKAKQEALDYIEKNKYSSKYKYVKVKKY